MGSVRRRPWGAYIFSFCSWMYLETFFRTCQKKHHSFLHVSSNFPLGISWISKNIQAVELVFKKSKKWIFIWRDTTLIIWLTPTAYNKQPSTMDSSHNYLRCSLSSHAHKSRRTNPLLLTSIWSINKQMIIYTAVSYAFLFPHS